MNSDQKLIHSAYEDVMKGLYVMLFQAYAEAGSVSKRRTKKASSTATLTQRTSKTGRHSQGPRFRPGKGWCPRFHCDERLADPAAFSDYGRRDSQHRGLHGAGAGAGQD